MNYDILDLQNGMKLEASHLNHMQNGIKNAYVNIDEGTSTDITLSHNIEFRRGTITQLNIEVPSEIPKQLNCSVAFISGETATQVSLPGGIILLGDGNENGSITINKNTRYNLMFWYDGAYIWCGITSASVANTQ